MVIVDNDKCFVQFHPLLIVLILRSPFIKPFLYCCLKCILHKLIYCRLPIDWYQISWVRINHDCKKNISFSYNLFWWWKIVKWKLVKRSMVNKSWRAILSGKDNEIHTGDFDTADLMKKNHRRFGKVEPLSKCG